MSMAPTSTMPWMALAPDISGVCRVAGTLLITSNPTSRLSTKTVRAAEQLQAHRHLRPWSIAAVRDRGLTTAPSCMTTTAGLDLVVEVDGEYAVADQVRSAARRCCGRRRSMRRWPSSAGRLPAPITVTPLSVTTVASGTEPGHVAAERTGGEVDDAPSRGASRRAPRQSPAGVARRPGTCAVVMTTSKRAICSASCALLRVPLRPRSSCRAYPPAPAAPSPRRRSRNRAPSDCDLGPAVRAARRRPVTTAPSRRAVPIACSPATPAPSTRTAAGPDGAGRGHQHREEPAVRVGGEQRRLVAGDVRLRSQRVHRLRPAEGARQPVQADRGHAASARCRTRSRLPARAGRAAPVLDADPSRASGGRARTATTSAVDPSRRRSWRRRRVDRRR